MVVDRSQEDGLAQVGRRLLAERVREAARGEAMVAALPGRPARMPAVLGRFRQVEEREQLALRALEELEREAVAGDDQEAGLFAGSRHVRADAGFRDVDGWDFAHHGFERSGSTILS